MLKQAKRVPAQRFPRMAVWLTAGWSLLSWAVQEARRAVRTHADPGPTAPHLQGGAGPRGSNLRRRRANLLPCRLGSLVLVVGVVWPSGSAGRNGRWDHLACRSAAPTHGAASDAPFPLAQGRGARPGLRGRRTCGVTSPRDASGGPGRGVALPVAAGSTSDRTPTTATGSPHTPKHCARCSTALAATPASAHLRPRKRANVADTRRGAGKRAFPTPASAHLRPRKRASFADTRRGLTPDWDTNLRLEKGSTQARASDSHSCVPMPCMPWLRPVPILPPSSFAMADTPELFECRICGRRPATDRDRGRCGPCDAVARLQGMVQGSDLQVWMVAVVSSMLHGMADGLHALLYGPLRRRSPRRRESRSRSRSPISEAPAPGHRGRMDIEKGKGKGKRREKGKGKGGGPPPRRSSRDTSTAAVAREVSAAAAEATARQAAFEPRHLTAVEFLTKATLRRAADQSPSVRGSCKKKHPVVCLHGSLDGNYIDRRGGTMARMALATRTRRSASRVPDRAAEPLEGKRGRVLLPHPTLGCSIGEAAHPGPPSHQHDYRPNPARADRARALEPHDEASRQRSRALHALAQMRLLPERVAHDSGAETVSDTLSAHTAVASPRQSYSPAGAAQPEHVFAGAAAPTQPDEAIQASRRHTPPHGQPPLADGPRRRHHTQSPGRVTLGCSCH